LVLLPFDGSGSGFRSNRILGFIVPDRLFGITERTVASYVGCIWPVVEDLPFDDLRDLSAALRQAHPNVVVWLLDEETLIPDHTDLLWVERGCAVIAVLDDGRRSSVKLRPHRTVLEPPSMDGLIQALRNVAERP